MTQGKAEHPFGRAINAFKISDEKKAFDKTELEQLLSHPEIQDRKVVILSVIGAFRGGKSFFLDYCLRFLYANFPSISNPNKKTKLIFENNEEWFGQNDEPLSGFSWRSGMERDTIGIIMWSDVFLHTMDRTGEKIAIFVIDTQGLFDSNSSSADNSKIFSLSTLTSSIQVLNIMKQIQEDQLQYLQIATEFTKFSIIDSGASLGKPFQNLIFLIRDWDNVDEYDYGSTGGQAYINKVLKIDESKNADIRSVREMIYVSFEEIKCSLLPYPGTNVAGRKKFDGSWSAMSDDFKTGLKSTIEYILMPENMILKKINSKEVTVKEMANYMQSYFEHFQSSDNLEIASLYDLTVKNHMTILVQKCIDEYKNYMALSKNFINEENLSKFHKLSQDIAFEMYAIERKMGKEELIKKYEREVLDGINDIFLIYQDKTKDNSKETEEDLKKLEAKYEDKLQQKQDAMKTIQQIRDELNYLNNKGKDYNNEKFRRHKLMLEARELAERERIETIDEDIRKLRDFLMGIAVAIGVTISIIFAGIPAGFAAMIAGAATIVTVKNSIDQYCYAGSLDPHCYT